MGFRSWGMVSCALTLQHPIPAHLDDEGPSKGGGTIRWYLISSLNDFCGSKKDLYNYFFYFNVFIPLVVNLYLK